MKRNKIALLIVVLLLLTMACVCSNSALPAIPTVPPVQIATEAPSTSSGFITDVIMARDTSGDLKEPVDPTTVFHSDSVIHAVVQIKDAPANTSFTAVFYVGNVGSAAEPNSLIGSTDVVADGSRYIDFTLTPTTSWPAGSYYVEIKVNGEVDQTVDYTVE